MTCSASAPNGNPDWYQGHLPNAACVPLGRQGSVDEIAATCLFLVSEDAGFIPDRRSVSMAAHTITNFSRRAAGSRSTRTECPRICWHTIFIRGNPQWYGKPLKQRGPLPRSGGHSSRYWCQEDSDFGRSQPTLATAGLRPSARPNPGSRSIQQQSTKPASENSVRNWSGVWNPIHPGSAHWAKGELS